METQERRLFYRFNARFPVKIKDAQEDFGDSIFLRDASAWGIKLTTKDRFYLNDSLSLEVALPDGLFPLNLRGQVIWTKNNTDQSWDVGLRFHNISLMYLSRLYSHAMGVGWDKPI